MSGTKEPCIVVRDLTMAFGSFVLQRDLNFSVNRGDIFIIMGGSGCGKSTLLRHLVGLQTRHAVHLNHFWIGLFSSAVFGILVAVAGCMRGMQCGRSASAVGEATTSAVVTGIVSIIVATAVITLICNVLGI